MYDNNISCEWNSNCCSDISQEITHIVRSVHKGLLLLLFCWTLGGDSAHF